MSIYILISICYNKYIEKERKIKMRNYKHLTYTQRLQIETLLKVKTPVKTIADTLGVHKSTIYREIKRGLYTRLTSEYEFIESYSPDIADKEYRNHLKAKGTTLKLANDYALANYIEYKITNEKYSPRAVLGEIKAQHKEFKTSISVTTLYRYIDEGVFLSLSNKNLPLKRNKKKRKYNRVKSIKVAKGMSIEQRPQDINNRFSFGHWEMDCVESKKGVKSTLLVLTERYTRFEIIKKLKDHTQNSVLIALNQIEKKLGAKKFSKIFQTITTDNGAEFLNFEEIEKSCITHKKRTQLYYCHSYCSWEKGTTENQNKMIRRHYPKGTSFANVPIKNIKKLQDWINNYPREIFNYYTSLEMFHKFCDVDL